MTFHSLTHKKRPKESSFGGKPPQAKITSGIHNTTRRPFCPRRDPPKQIKQTMGDDVDYGYSTQDYEGLGYGPDSGEQYDYNDPSAMDYGYGDTPTDYGYDETPTDYGYDETPTDYGYGDSPGDFGYGDAAPDEANENPAPLPPPKEKRPKRRCSVTRFSIEAEANNKSLDYDWTPEQPAQQAAPEAAPEPAADEKSSAQTESTVESSDEGGSMLDKINKDKVNAAPKKGMMSRIRKRLSIM